MILIKIIYFSKYSKYILLIWIWKKIILISKKDDYSTQSFLWFGIMLPTLIHVFIFTGLFIIYGALKNRSISDGVISFLIFLRINKTTNPIEKTYIMVLPINRWIYSQKKMCLNSSNFIEKLTFKCLIYLSNLQSIKKNELFLLAYIINI